MRVKANKETFKYYRCVALGINKKDFRKLQKGDEADVDEKIVKKYPHAFIVFKEGKK